MSVSIQAADEPEEGPSCSSTVPGPSCDSVVPRVVEVKDVSFVSRLLISSLYICCDVYSKRRIASQYCSGESFRSVVQIICCFRGANVRRRGRFRKRRRRRRERSTRSTWPARSKVFISVIY